VNTENGLDDFRAKLMRWSTLAPKELKTAIQRGAELIRREAQERHLSGPKMPRGVGDEMNATLSAPTGTLRRSISIRVKVAAGEIEGLVGTTVGYGRKHELGLGGMPERPFLRSSLFAKRMDALKEIKHSFLNSYKEA